MCLALLLLSCSEEAVQDIVPVLEGTPHVEGEALSVDLEVHPETSRDLPQITIVNTGTVSVSHGSGFVLDRWDESGGWVAVDGLIFNLRGYETLPGDRFVLARPGFIEGELNVAEALAPGWYRVTVRVSVGPDLGEPSLVLRKRFEVVE